MDHLKYFQVHQDYFWHWEENREVVAIPGGYTIAYRNFVGEIINTLAPQGLPPFGALLLTILATNPKAEEGLKIVDDLIESATRNNAGEQLIKAMAFLNALKNLPETYKTGKKRILIFQTIFQNCHNRFSAKKSEGILDLFFTYEPDSVKANEKAPFNYLIYNRDFSTLSLLKDKYPNERSIRQKMVGLREIPEEVFDLETPPEQEGTPPDFIEQLIANDTTFFVGALVKRIWSGLNIPFHNNVPSKQPLGGIADITNKGDFDKLLLTEFAQDDLVFLSRLANNEALYFHREIPPADNNLHRIVLLDVSLKNWGTVRTIAMATMLAIAKHPKTDIECSVFVVGDQYHPVNIETIDGVIEGLQILEGSLDASVGLKEFFKNNDLNNKEVFLISTSEAMDYPAIQKVLFEHQSVLNYWIHPVVDGTIQLYKKQGKGKKFVQKIKLPLKDLWARERPIRKPVSELEISEYPILFENPIGVKKVLICNDGHVYKITKEKALLKSPDFSFKREYSGWDMLYDKIPFVSGEFAIGKTEADDLILLMFNPQTNELALLNIKSKKKTYVEFEHWRSSGYREFFFHKNQFYFISHGAYWTIDLNGAVTKNEKTTDDLKKIYQQKKKEREEMARKHNYSIQIFKNVTRVFINQNNNLVFNIHQLYINPHTVIKLDATNDLTEKRGAEVISKTLFAFSDGSTVMVNKVGMLILKSSNPHIPVIYVPSVLDRSLGVAVDGFFAGNDYYKRKQICDVVLSNIAGKPLHAIKVIKDVIGIGLADAKAIVDLGPGAMIKDIHENNASLLKVRLNEIGGDAEIQFKTKNIEKIDSPVFFNKYIKSFISHIISHGATD